MIAHDTRDVYERFSSAITIREALLVFEFGDAWSLRIVRNCWTSSIASTGFTVFTATDGIFNRYLFYLL